ncbi:hypothetical protein [Telmatospirillum sp. J64-1]|uniref:hypothetical protein n=1 Tax=Telmatospirillum sp. J64-1 TaxID=2502183 RepID=UPI00115EABEB|nr:hypothetical protein [Telmatospirillum sp. J64-1]
MDDVETYRRELGERLAVVTARFPSKGAAAQAAGVTTEQFNKWLAGSVKVPVEGLWRLARSAGVDFKWLCAGGGADLAVHPDNNRALRADVMQDVLQAMIGATRDGDVVYASPAKFSELALALHDFVIEQRRSSATPVDLAQMGNIIRLASR